MKDNEWEEGLNNRLEETRYIVPEKLEQSDLNYSDDWDTLELKLTNLPAGEYLIDYDNYEDMIPLEEVMAQALDDNFTRVRVRDCEYGSI